MKSKFKIGEKVTVRLNAPIHVDRLHKGVHIIVDYKYLKVSDDYGKFYYLTNKDKYGIWENFLEKATELGIVLYE